MKFAILVISFFTVAAATAATTKAPAKKDTTSICARLNKAVSNALDNPTLRTRFDAIGLIPAAPERRSPAYLRTFIEAEVAKWAGPVKASGLHIE